VVVSSGLTVCHFSKFSNKIWPLIGFVYFLGFGLFLKLLMAQFGLFDLATLPKGWTVDREGGR